MTKTKREIQNKFILSFLLMFLFIGFFEISIIKYTQNFNNLWILLFSLGLFGIIINTLWMFYIGYSQGWELKRQDTFK